MEKVLKTFIGKQEQIPPKYAAIKVNGRKLYDYARKGVEIEIKSRQIEIYNIKLESINHNKKEIVFYVKCSKGTYIRTLCEDIARKLGTVGFMKELNRIAVGELNIKDSVKIRELENKIKSEKLCEIISIEDLLNFPEIEINSNDLNKYLNGVSIKTNFEHNGPCKVYLDKRFIGTGIIKNKELKRDVVI